jgi:hypothetical protein
MAVVEKLAAAHALASPERIATERDLLISTALDFLLGGAQSTEAIFEHCLATWPGTGLEDSRVMAALETARTMEYVEANGSTWSLTRRGSDEARNAREWANASIQTTSRELADRAQRGYRETSEEEALTWTRLLLQALFAGLNAEYVAYRGDVAEYPGAITPRSYDVDAMQASLASAVRRADAREFLTAMLFDILDPSQPFGNDLVTSVTTAYMIQAFLAGRGRIAALEATGGLRRRRAVLDTPAVLPMLGSAGQYQPVNRAIAAAVRSGMDVIVPEHVIEELLRLVDRFDRGGLKRVTAAIAQGAEPAAIRQLTDDPVLALWLGGQESSRYESWSEFLQAARRLPGHLRRLGVDVRPHRNGPRDRVNDCEGRLRQSLQQRERARGDMEIERDAHTMAMAWRTRRVRDVDVTVWPASWVITTDSHMDRAFGRLSRDDPHPLTLTPSQWVGVVASACDPIALDDLARSAASLFTQEAALAVSSGYPAEAAAEIAKALRPDSGASETDLRVAQMTVARPSNVQTLLEDPESAAVGIASLVVAQRSQRMKASRDRSTRRLESDRDAARNRATKERLRADVERSQRTEAEHEADTLRTQLDAERTGRQEDRLLFRRRLTLGIVGTGLAFGMVWLFLSGYVWSAGFSALSLAVLVVFAYDWISDVRVDWKKMGIAFIPQIGSVIEIVGRWQA